MLATLAATIICSLVSPAAVCGQAGDSAAHTGPGDPNQLHGDLVDQTPRQLAARMRAYLAGLDKLRVETEQRVSYLNLENPPLEALRDASEAIEQFADQVITVDVRIVAEMTQDSYTVTMWRGEEQRPVSIVTLAPKDGVPFIIERQWYPVLNDYRVLSRPSPHPYGYDDPALEGVLFSSIDAPVCATAEFFHTWLGESEQADMFERIIGAARSVPDAAATSVQSVRLHRQVYDHEEDNRYQSSDQFFLLSVESPILQEWTTELVSLNSDERDFHYMIVQRRYRYFDGSSEIGRRSDIDTEQLSP